ncbi:hypothetical protein [Kineosporia babensis]|uniref:Uncharacterized protein n=1 Tax=Kineosporia babensis TaxID=499548 RepID=A0A9X1SSQ8_9ACTN|nr:hypothetical protein [Kineosporia babensis]MCD5310839.1 hypothetical protein [Kineosporia babensis]
MSDFPEVFGSLHLHTSPEGTWTVADGGGWYPGVYDSRSTAIAATELPFVQLAKLWKQHVADNGPGPRPFTIDDLKTEGT